MRICACVLPLPRAPFPGVFFGSDFVTVTKSDDYAWAVLKPDIFAAMMDHFSSGEPLFTDKEALEASDTAIHEDDDEVGGFFLKGGRTNSNKGGHMGVQDPGLARTLTDEHRWSVIAPRSRGD